MRDTLGRKREDSAGVSNSSFLHKTNARIKNNKSSRGDTRRAAPLVAFNDVRNFSPEGIVSAEFLLRSEPVKYSLLSTSRGTDVNFSRSSLRQSYCSCTFITLQSSRACWIMRNASGRANQFRRKKERRTIKIWPE